MRRRWRRKKVKEVKKSQGPRVSRSKGPKVQGSQGPGIPRPRGPKDQDISNSHSNTSLTLKKVHLVILSLAFVRPVLILDKLENLGLISKELSSM